MWRLSAQEIWTVSRHGLALIDWEPARALTDENNWTRFKRNCGSRRVLTVI